MAESRFACLVAESGNLASASNIQSIREKTMQSRLMAATAMLILFTHLTFAADPGQRKESGSRSKQSQSALRQEIEKIEEYRKRIEKQIDEAANDLAKADQAVLFDVIFGGPKSALWESLSDTTKYGGRIPNPDLKEPPHVSFIR